jgi:hypothetical protein
MRFRGLWVTTGVINKLEYVPQFEILQCNFCIFVSFDFGNKLWEQNQNAWFYKDYKLDYVFDTGYILPHFVYHIPGFLLKKVYS